MDNQYFNKDIPQYAKAHPVIAFMLSGTAPNGQKQLFELFTFASDDGNLTDADLLDFMRHRNNNEFLRDALPLLTAQMLESALSFQFDGNFKVKYEGKPEFEHRFLLLDETGGDSFRFHNLTELAKIMKLLGNEWRYETPENTFDVIPNNFRLADQMMVPELWDKVHGYLKAALDQGSGYNLYDDYLKNTDDHKILWRFLKLCKDEKFSQEPYDGTILMQAFSQLLEAEVHQAIIENVKLNPNIIDEHGHALYDGNDWVADTSETWHSPDMAFYWDVILIGNVSIYTSSPAEALSNALESVENSLRQEAQEHYNETMIVKESPQPSPKP